MKKILRQIIVCTTSIISWSVLATGVNILCLLSFVAILGKDSGGRGEVLRSLAAAGITGLLTVSVIVMFFRKGFKNVAVSMSIAAFLLGGYYFFIIMAFGWPFLFNSN